MGFKSWIIPKLPFLGLNPCFVECEWGMTLFSPDWSYLWVLLQGSGTRPCLFNLVSENQNITVIMDKQRSQIKAHTNKDRIILDPDQIRKYI